MVSQLTLQERKLLGVIVTLALILVLKLVLSCSKNKQAFEFMQTINAFRYFESKYFYNPNFN